MNEYEKSKINQCLKDLEEIRIQNLRDSNMYQRLSVAPEHWNTVRKDAYRESYLSCKQRSKSLQFAIHQLKKLSSTHH